MYFNILSMHGHSIAILINISVTEANTTILFKVIIRKFSYCLSMNKGHIHNLTKFKESEFLLTCWCYINPLCDNSVFI